MHSRGVSPWTCRDAVPPPHAQVTQGCGSDHWRQRKNTQAPREAGTQRDGQAGLQGAWDSGSHETGGAEGRGTASRTEDRAAPVPAAAWGSLGWTWPHLHGPLTSCRASRGQTSWRPEGRRPGPLPAAQPRAAARAGGVAWEGRWPASTQPITCCLLSLWGPASWAQSRRPPAQGHGHWATGHPGRRTSPRKSPIACDTLDHISRQGCGPGTPIPSRRG